MNIGNKSSDFKSHDSSMDSDSVQSTQTDVQKRIIKEVTVRFFISESII